MKTHIFTTGGTIDKLYYDAASEFSVGEPQVGVFLREAGADGHCDIEPLLRKDSLDMGDEDRALIRRAVENCPQRNILITHGTDTMVETARALLGIEGKTVVLTGAMLPARMRHSDAAFNIGFALAALGQLGRAGDGVYIAMGGQIFDPRRVRKNRQGGRFEAI